MNLWLSLNKALTLYPDKEAFVDGAKRFTYRHFGERVRSLIVAFQRLGLGKGAVIAIAAPNSHEYMEVYYACALAGFVLNPLNYRLSVREIAAILQDAEAQLLIVHTDFVEQANELIDLYPHLKPLVVFGDGNASAINHLPYEELAAADAGRLRLDELPQPHSDDLAQLYYTSGTTGVPKGVMLTQGNVTFNALAVIADLELKESDVWLHAAPMFHLADAWATFAITWAGGTHVFMPYFEPTQALSLIEQEGITLTLLVPTMLNAMMNVAAIDQHDYRTMRMILTGGSPIAPELVRRATERFGCDYVQLYGMTETSPFLTLSRPKACQHESLSRDELFAVRTKTGRGYIGAEVKVVRSDGSEVEHNGLEVGEIIARGPTIFAGYWKKPEATEQTKRNGWIYTGDLAVIDEDGFINIVDRAKDMIITGGENVYSTEVEFALHEHESVLECAVFGVPHEFWGEAVHAVVVLRSGHKSDEKELIAFLRERLAHYKVPRQIEFAESLPKTGSGKIYKKDLRERFWQQREKQVN
jgi:acyl-CoA synthetase (AMP-forming)/AMP-acid ligase II